MNDLKESIEQSIKTDLIGNVETLEQENEDLWNWSMRSTLIFHGVMESERKKKKFLGGGISESSWSAAGSQIEPGLLWIKYVN